MNKGKTLLLLGIVTLLFGIMGYFFYNNVKESQKPQEETIYLEPICLTEIQIPLLIQPMELEKTNDKEELKELMKECQERKKIILSLMPEKSSINYYSHRKTINEEVHRINHIYSIYKNQYDEIVYQEELAKKKAEEAKRRAEEERRRKEEEAKRQEEAKKQQTTVSSNSYSNAAIIWNYLRNLGYNKYVCAGILGNIMTEVGGQTLNIRPGLYGEGNNYYGICQWSLKYYPSINGANLTTQLNFLAETIKYEFNTYGYLYYSEFNYNTFLNLNSTSEAALAFAKVYERCSSDSYTKRQNNANIAYNYFVG